MNCGERYATIEIMESEYNKKPIQMPDEIELLDQEDNYDEVLLFFETSNN